MTIEQAISKRNKLRAESRKLFSEGDKLWDASSKPFAEGRKLRAEGYLLYAEGHKLWAEGDLVVINAVISEHGPKAIIEFDGEKVKIERNTTTEN